MSTEHQEEVSTGVLEAPLRQVLANKTLNTAKQIKFLEQLIGLVWRKHFQSYPHPKEDLVQEAFVKVIPFIQDNVYDPKVSSAVNYLYTRIRNSMTNYVNKKTPTPAEESEFYDQQDQTSVSADLLARVERFIEERLKSWSLQKDVANLLRISFQEKIGVESELVGVVEASEDLVTKYVYYKNALEYDINGTFMHGSPFHNKFNEILYILKCENELYGVTELFYNSFTAKELEKIFYVSAGNTIKMPQKIKLFRIDQSLSIYKSIKSGKYSIEEACKVYAKSYDVIEKIYSQYEFYHS